MEDCNWPLRWKCFHKIRKLIHQQKNFMFRRRRGLLLRVTWLSVNHWQIVEIMGNEIRELEEIPITEGQALNRKELIMHFYDNEFDFDFQSKMIHDEYLTILDEE